MKTKKDKPSAGVKTAALGGASRRASEASSPKQETREHLEACAEDMVHALCAAHRLIMDHVEGKPLNFNRLENYFGCMADFMTRFPEERGALLEVFLEVLACSVFLEVLACSTWPQFEYVSEQPGVYGVLDA
jgi:hypothetical protein